MSTDVLRYLRPASAAEPTGRETELSVLLREHHDARAAGAARFVFVRGPRGVGKSHLMHQLASTLSAQGAPIFEGGSARDGKKTWGVVAPMVDGLLTFARRNAVPEATLSRLVRALEPLRGTSVGSASDDRRLALYDAMAELVNLAGRSATPLFVFPDLDVADRASLELVRYLSAVVATPDARVSGLFVLTFREDEALPQPLAELLSHVPGRTLPLAGLDLEGIRSFLSRQDIAQKLLELTGGNPDALGELLERPVAAADFFSRRFERLSEVQRTVLTALAVAPEALPVDCLAEALGSELEPLAATLDALLKEHLVAVRVIDGRASWRLSRESEKRAVLVAVSAAQRDAASLAVGRALVALEPMAAAELLLAVAPAEGAAVALIAARALVDRGALEDAEALLARVAPLVRGDGRATFLETWGRCLLELGEYRQAARRLLEAARGAHAPALWLLAARALIKLGRSRFARASLDAVRADAAFALEGTGALVELLINTGRSQEALLLAQHTLEGVSTVDRPALALRQSMGKAMLVLGQLESAQTLFAQNAAHATTLDDTRLLALARLNEGVAAYKRGNLERAVECWKSTPVESRPLHAHAEANLGSLYAEAGDFELALSHLGRALSAFSRFGSVREVAQAASNFARLHLFLGDLERANQLSEHTLALARRLADGYLEATAQLNLGTIAVEQREHAAARRHLEAARVGFEAQGNDGYAALAAAWKARSHLLSGERAQAEVELSRKCVEKGVAALHSTSLEVELTRAELSLSMGDLLGAGRATSRAREALLDKPDLEGPIFTSYLAGRARALGNDTAGAQLEFQRAGRLLDELISRVPPVRRTAFLSLARRAEVVAAVEPELRLPRAMASLVARPALELGHGLIGRSPSLQKITRQLEPIGRSNATVLVRGESGTGKEVLADALHTLSPRRHMPLVKVNCAAMVEELLLSELFGHEKGAFTGAIRERKGRFELADGGTIFLDEIGDISPKAQVALLRVLQEREFERVGGSKTIKVDVRIICATNRDLESLIRDGRFRADLYYRLKGVMLELPPLRERLDDLPQLSQHFLERVAKESGAAVRSLSPAAHALLARHRWPGNIRELENVIASASIFAEGAEIDVEAFSHVAELHALTDGIVATAPLEPSRPLATSPLVAVPMAPATPTGPLDYYELARKRDLSLKDLRHEVEMQCIRRALEEADGNISEAARLLKMKRSRLSQIVNGESELKEVAHGDEE